MTRRLLLAAGSGGAFTLPVPSAFALTSSPNGGTNPWNIPSAYRYGTTTYIGYVDSSGNIEAITYSDAGSTGGPYTIHAAFQADLHTSPSFCRRTSDGKIVAVYTAHNATPINRRISTNADDVSAWGSATNIHSQLGGTRYTDVQLHELSDGTLFLFYRDEPSAGTDSRWCWSTSTDGGTTWAAQTILYKVASTRTYVVTWKAPGSDVIHFIATNTGSSTKLGHFTMDGLTLARKKSDGTTISASLPLVFTDITTAYTGTAGVYQENIVLSGSEVAVSGEDTIGGALHYMYARWNGSAWVTKDLGAAGTGYEYSGTGTGFAQYGCWVDDGDLDTVWALVQVGSWPELFRYRTADGGVTFSSLQVTSGGTQLQISPCVVRNPYKLRGYWMDTSSYTDYTTWTASLRGVLNP